MSTKNTSNNTMPICHKFLKGKCYGACKYRHEMPSLDSRRTSSGSHTSKPKNRNDKHKPYNGKPKRYNSNKSNYTPKHNSHHVAKNSNNYPFINTSSTTPEHVRQTSVKPANFRRLCCANDTHSMYIMYVGEKDTDECIKRANKVADCYEMAMPLNIERITMWHKIVKHESGMKFNASVIPNNSNPERSTILFTFMLRSANEYLYHMTLFGTEQRTEPEHSEWCQYLFARFCPKFPININKISFDDFKQLYNYCLFKMNAYLYLPSVELEMYMHHMMAMYWAIHSFCISNNIIIPNNLDIDYISDQCQRGLYY